MQRHIDIFKKFLSQLGEQVTAVAKTGCDLPPLTQVARLGFSGSQNDYS